MNSIHLEDIWSSLACQTEEETSLESWVIGFYKELEQVDALNKTSDALYKYNPWTKSPFPIVFKIFWFWNKTTLKWTEFFIEYRELTYMWLTRKLGIYKTFSNMRSLFNLTVPIEWTNITFIMDGNNFIKNTFVENEGPQGTSSIWWLVALEAIIQIWLLVNRVLGRIRNR